MKPSMHFSKVDFPAPFGPTMAVSEFFSIAAWMFCKTGAPP